MRRKGCSIVVLGLITMASKAAALSDIEASLRCCLQVFGRVPIGRTPRDLGKVGPGGSSVLPSGNAVCLYLDPRPSVREVRYFYWLAPEGESTVCLEISRQSVPIDEVLSWMPRRGYVAEGEGISTPEEAEGLIRNPPKPAADATVAAPWNVQLWGNLLTTPAPAQWGFREWATLTGVFLVVELMQLLPQTRMLTIPLGPGGELWCAPTTGTGLQCSMRYPPVST